MVMLLPRWRRFAGAERLSRLSQITLNMNNERVRAAENAPRGPFYVHERRHGLADIVERGPGVPEERPSLRHRTGRAATNCDR